MIPHYTIFPLALSSYFFLHVKEKVTKNKAPLRDVFTDSDYLLSAAKSSFMSLGDPKAFAEDGGEERGGMQQNNFHGLLPFVQSVGVVMQEPPRGGLFFTQYMCRAEICAAMKEIFFYFFAYNTTE